MSDENKEVLTEEVVDKVPAKKKTSKKAKAKKVVGKKRELSASQLKEIHELDAFKTTERPKPGTIVSRLPHPTYISYEGKNLTVPPRAQGKTAIVVENYDKLGALPAGVACLERDAERRKARRGA